MSLLCLREFIVSPLLCDVSPPPRKDGGTYLVRPDFAPISGVIGLASTEKKKKKETRSVKIKTNNSNSEILH